MPSKSPTPTNAVAAQLTLLGQQIRTHRKALRVSASTAAQAAGMSRVTLHRIEGGEPSVTMGAYLNAMAALGLSLDLVKPAAVAANKLEDDRKGWIPARVRLADYPQLKQLAWQVQGTDELTPREALDIYERNWRHLDLPTMQAPEQNLIAALRLALGEGRSDV